MEKDRRPPWGAQDALQAKRGLLHAITPEYLAAKSEYPQAEEPSHQSQPLQHQPDPQLQRPFRMRALRHSQHQDSDKSYHPRQQEELQYQQLTQPQQQELDKNLLEGHQQHTHQLCQLEAKLPQLHENLHRRQRPQRSVDSLEMGRNREEYTSQPLFRPRTAGKHPPTAAAIGGSGFASSAVRTTTGTDPLATNALEQAKLQRCSSWSSVRHLQHWPLQIQTDQDDKQQPQQQVAQKQSRKEQQLQRQAQPFPHPRQRQQHYFQQQQEHSLPTLSQCSPQDHEKWQSGAAVTLRKTLSDATRSKYPMQRESHACSPVLHRHPHSTLKGEAGRQEQGASAFVCDMPSVATVDAQAVSARAPLPDALKPAAADSSFTSTARLHAISDPVTTACPASATVTRAAAATQPCSGALTANAAAPAAPAPTFEEEAALLHASSRGQPTGRSCLRVQQQNQSFSPVDPRFRQQLQQAVCDGAATAAAAARRVQAAVIIGSVPATEAAKNCASDLRCSWLQSRTYAAFSEIATELIHQQPQLSRTLTAAHAGYPTPSGFRTGAPAVEARGLSCTGTHAATHKGAKRESWTSVAIHTAHHPSMAYASPVQTRSYVAGAAALPTGENQQQDAASLCARFNPNRKRVGSAAPTATRQNSTSQHAQEQLAHYLREQYHRQQQQHPQQPKPWPTQQEQPQLSGQRVPQGPKKENSTASPLGAYEQQEQQKASYQNHAPVFSSLQPPTACCSSATGASALHTFTSPSRVTDGAHPRVVALGSPLDSPAISPVRPPSTAPPAAVGNDVISAAAVSSPSSSPPTAYADSPIVHASVSVPASSAPALSSATAAGEPPTCGARPATLQSDSCWTATGVAFAFAGAAADSTSGPTSPCVNAAATSCHVAPADVAAPTAAAHQTSAAALPAAPGSDTVSTLKRCLAARARQQMLLQQQGSNGCSGVKLRTCLDISSYSLDSAHLEAVRDTETAAVAPGPLLLLFAFYSRVFSYIRKGHICREVSVSQEESIPRRKTPEASSANSAGGNKFTSTTRRKGGGRKCSGGEQADASTNQASSSGESEDAGTSKISRSSSTTSEIASSAHASNGRRSCEKSSRSNPRVEDSSGRKCSCCGRLRRDSSTSRKLPLRASLSRLLHDPVSFDQPCFGLLEAQEMVEHFSRHLQPFSISPSLVEELWVLVLLTTSVTPVAAADDQHSDAEFAIAASSETVQAALASSFLPLSRVSSGNTISSSMPPFRAASVTIPSRGRSAAGNSSHVLVENRTVAASVCAREASTAERIRRPATSGGRTLYSDQFMPASTSVTSTENSTLPGGLLLNRSSRQFREMRVNFLGFTAFFAAVVTLAVKRVFATARPARSETTPCSASSTTAGEEQRAPLLSTALPHEYPSVTPTVQQAPAVVASPIAEQCAAALTAAANFIREPAAAVDTKYPAGPACADVEQTCTAAGSTERSSTEKSGQLSNFQCVQQFMQRLGSAGAVKRFLIEVYKELHTCAQAVEDKTHKNDRQKSRALKSVARNTDRAYNGLKARVKPAAAASARSATATGVPSMVTESEPAAPVRNDRISQVTKTQRMEHEDVGMGQQKAARRKTEEIHGHSARVNDWIGCLPKRCNSDAVMHLKGAAYKHILTSSTIPWGFTAAEAQERPDSRKQSVAFKNTDEFTYVGARAAGRPSLPHPGALTEPREQQQNARLSNMTAHPFRRHLWSVLPDRGTLQWLLQRYTFSNAAPIWVPFAALFIDMGMQRVLALQRRPSGAEQTPDKSSHRQGARSTGPVKEKDEEPYKQQHEMLTGAGQHDAANRNVQLPAKTHPKERTYQNLLSAKTDIGDGGGLYQTTANEGQLQHQVTQERSVAGAVSAKAPSASDCAAFGSASGNTIAKAAAAVGAVAPKTASADRGGAAAVGTFSINTPATEGTVAAKNCSTCSVAFVDPAVPLEAASAASRCVAETVPVSPAIGIPAGVTDSRLVACCGNCVPAAGSSQAACTCCNPLATTAAAGGDARVAPHVAVRAAAPAPLRVDNGVQQERQFPAGDTAAAEDPPAAATPAEGEAQLSLKELPPARWQLVQQRAAQQRRQLHEHAAVLQTRAKQIARRHRFAIEVENNTTAPILVVVDLENLPPVETAQGSACSTPLLLVPGCSKRITLDVDRTHEPGEWLGFAHVRLRSRRSRNTATVESGNSSTTSCNGDCCNDWKRIRGRSSSSGCYNSKNVRITGSSRSCSPSSWSQRELRSTRKNSETSNSSKGDGSHSSRNSSHNGGCNGNGAFFYERVVSIPVYLRLLRDQEHQDAAPPSAAPTQAAAESVLPVAVPTATAAAAGGASASSAATGRVCGHEDSIELQKGRGQRRARPLSPLPLHADRASIAAVLGFAWSHKFQSFSPGAFCSASVASGASQCQQNKQETQCQQEQPRRCHQREQLPPQHPKQPQPHTLIRAASEGDIVPSATDAARCSANTVFAELQQSKYASPASVRAGCTSSIAVDCRRSTRCLESSTVRPTPSCAQAASNCSSVRSRSDTRKCSFSGACISPPISSSRMPPAGQRTDQLRRSIDGSSSTTHGSTDVGSNKSNTGKESSHEKDSSIDRRNSRDMNCSNGEDRRGARTSIDSADTSQEATQEVCVSPSLSVTSSSSVDGEVDWRPGTATLLTGQRLNAREYSFVYRAEMLERLRQEAPDCYHLGQQLLRQQQRLQRQYRQQFRMDNSQRQQDKQVKQQHHSNADQQLQQCDRLHRQPSEGQSSQYRHIRWLRGHLLYGENPVEGKGWATREAAAAAAAAQQRQQQRRRLQERQKISPTAKKTDQRARAEEKTNTLSPAVEEACGDHFFSGKLPCNNSLFHYDTSDNGAFRCSGCGLSFWGKHKREAEEDPLTALRNFREEELREASTASCSTSVPLPWYLQQH